MPTDDARLAEARQLAANYRTFPLPPWLDTAIVSDTIDYLLAELDRYRAYAGSDGVNRVMALAAVYAVQSIRVAHGDFGALLHDAEANLRAAVAGLVATADRWMSRVHEADVQGMEWQEKYEAASAEVNRLTRELVTVAAERDELCRQKTPAELKAKARAEAEDRWANTPERTPEEEAYWSKVYRCASMTVTDDDTSADNELDDLRAAYTWTPATPDTMPPPGSGPWLVAFDSCSAEAFGSDIWAMTVGEYLGGPCWLNGRGAPYAFERSRFCAMPADAPAPATEETP